MSSSTTSNVYMDAAILAALSVMDGLHLGNRTLWQLLQDAGSPTALWDASEAFLKAHLPEKKLQVFLERRGEGLKPERLETHEKLGIQSVPYTDPRYPGMLKEIHDPPALLYIKGNTEALVGKTIGVVGTRKFTEYGRQATEELICQLKPAGVTIVSGLAAGIDTVAHWAALHNHLPTVAVFGCGLDVIYPGSNRQLSEEILAAGGALVSEYPLGTGPSKFTFPQRNRIVAGLSHGILVVEGDLKSGALITAKQAMEEGRSVYAVPGNIFSPGSQGPLSLIRNGAVPVGAGEDILKDLNWWLEGVPRQLVLGTADETDGQGTGSRDSASEVFNLSEPEACLLKNIPFDPVAVDTLQQVSGLASAQVNELLTMLELEGLIVLLPGAKVCRK